MNTLITLLLAGAFAVAAAAGATAPSKPPFGGADDAAFAKQLWAAMTEARLVGPNALRTTTYQDGTGLHATTLTLLQGMVSVGSNTGLASSKTISAAPRARTSPTAISSDGRRTLAGRQR